MIYLPYIFKVINCHSGVVVKGFPIPQGAVGSTPLMGAGEMIFVCDLKTANQFLRVPFSLRHKR